MANIQINWTAPNISTLGNITSFTVLRGKVSGASVTQTCELLQAVAATGPAVGPISGNSDVECLLVDTPRTATTHTDQSVAAGTYLYGVYSVNSAGANDCLSDDGDGDSGSVAEIVVT